MHELPLAREGRRGGCGDLGTCNASFGVFFLQPELRDVEMGSHVLESSLGQETGHSAIRKLLEVRI